MAGKPARTLQKAPDLNDFFLFAQVVSHGGFSAASRTLDIPKSRLSRRIARLEERLGARLVQRSTRTFAITAAGQLFLQHCQRVVAEAEAAEAAVMEIQKTPRGLVRISCPITMAEAVLGQLLPQYIIDNPQVKVEVTSTGRSLKLIERAIDIALVIHKNPLPEWRACDRHGRRPTRVGKPAHPEGCGGRRSRHRLHGCGSAGDGSGKSILPPRFCDQPWRPAGDSAAPCRSTTDPLHAPRGTC